MNALLILRSEPVRAILYPLLAALVAWTVTKGFVDDSVAVWVTGLVALVLGVPATEKIRNTVTPVGKVVDVASEVISTVEREFRDDGKLDRSEVESIAASTVKSVLSRLKISPRAGL